MAWLILVALLGASCETTIQADHFKCSPTEPGSCPDGWICQKRGSDGIHRCYPSESGYCGDLVLDPGEACDGTHFVDFTCEDGWPICSRDCVPFCSDCGNGAIELDIESRGEECDDGNREGGDGCSPNCKIEKYCFSPTDDSCTEYCGDGILQSNFEECDGTAIASWYSCAKFDFYGGELACSSDCTLDLSSCVGYCGDTVVNGGEKELCDGADNGGLNCVDSGYDGGAIGCNYYCNYKNECYHYWNRELAGVTQHLHAIFGDLSGTVYAAGADGVVVLKNKSGWNDLSTGENTEFHGIWASSSNNIFAVGTRGAVARYTQGNWDFLNFNTTETFNAVWGENASSVYVAGEGGVLWSWDGAFTTHDASCFTGVSLKALFSVDGAVYAAGAMDRVARYSGGIWECQSLPIPTTSVVYRIWGDGSDNLLAVGEHEDQTGFVLHFDSGVWQEVTGPPSGLEGLRGIWGVDGRVTFLGRGGTLYTLVAGEWETFPNPHGGTFTALWGRSLDDLYISGFNGKIIHKLAHWQSSAAIFDGFVTALREDRLGVLWALTLQGTVYMNDGTGWTPHTALGGSSALDLAVWRNAAQEPVVYVLHSSSTLKYFNGQTWNDLSPPAELPSFAGCRPGFDVDGVLWLACTGGLIVSWVDGTPSVHNADGHLGTESLTALLLKDGRRLFWGDGGHVILFDGSQWSSVSAGTAVPVRSLWGTSVENAYGASDNGVVVHFDGQTATEQPTGGTFSLRQVFGASPNSVFGLGYYGELIHFDGTLWSPLTGLPLTSTALLVTSTGTVLVGENQRIWTGSINMPRTYGGYCSEPVTIYCGMTLHGDTSFGVNAFDAHLNCPGASNVNMGPEQSFQFQSPVSGRIRLTLSSAEDLDLIVSGYEEFGECDPDGHCLAMAQTTSDVEEIELDVTRGDLLYFIVDSQNNGPAPFSLALQCEQLRPEGP